MCLGGVDPHCPPRATRQSIKLTSDIAPEFALPLPRSPRTSTSSPAYSCFPARFARGYVLPALLLGLVAQAHTQTRLQRQLANVDLGLQATGQFTGTVSGPVVLPAVDTGTNITQSVSNTVGFLGTLRYAPRPYLGAEFNGSYVRYTESYNVAPLQIQTQSNEFTFGYLVTPPYRIFGVKPFASVGVGTIRFAPTRGGGQGAPPEARMGEYYNVGFQKELFSENFGLRAGFRQLFFEAPDFVQNYLTINKRTSTVEPTIGFYLRF